MISTDDRSPSGRDSTTTRLTNFNNNNNEDENSGLYYQYVPSSHLHPAEAERHHHPTLTTSQSTPSISVSSAPTSPLLRHRHPHNQIVLRDPHSVTHLHNNLSDSSSALALPSSSPPASPTSNGIADFIQQTLSSRLIPKLGSIVKRFSLNYSGEGLVTDRQRTRTVRVGIRFQVQVDSFVNNQQGDRPRAIIRTQSAPAVEQLDSGFSSPTTDVFPQNRQLALEYNNSGNRSISHSNSSSTLSVADYCCSSGAGSTSSANSSGGIQIGIGSGVDSCSSGVSSEASSPTLDRKAKNHHPTSLPFAQQEDSTSHTLAFHNRINQALNSYYRTHQQQKQQSSTEQPQQRARRSSVQVYRRGSASPERSGSISEDQPNCHTSGNSSLPSQAMEDSSSFQVLRHFPGSNVNSLNELSWETAAFEKEIRDRIQWFGDKMSGIRVPRIISQLVDFGREYAHENPLTALILFALCLTSSAPVLIFLVFAIATILVTFLGFLFVEGTLLTGATVIFGGVILAVGFVTLTAVLLGMVGYFTTTQAYLVVTGRSRIFKLLRKLPIIGRFFPKPSTHAMKAELDEDELINQQCSNLFANGKLSNGYGPYHGSVPAAHTTPYYVDEEDDDDIHDILESEDEVHIEEEVIKKADEEKSEVTLTTGTTSELSTSSELGEHEEVEKEDLGNQEIISDGANNEVTLVKAEETIVNGDTATSTPVVLTNGHGKEKSSQSDEESEINVGESIA